MSHSTNARLYPNMQPHRWPWPGLWAAEFPKQMEGPAKCLGGFPALPEPVPGAGITDVPPRQQSQHMPLLGRRWLGSDRTCTPRSTHQGISTVVLQGGLLEVRLYHLHHPGLLGPSCLPTSPDSTAKISPVLFPVFPLPPCLDQVKGRAPSYIPLVGSDSRWPWGLDPAPWMVYELLESPEAACLCM